MAFSLHGVNVPHRKNTADKPAVKMICPKSVTLPMSMHIGKPAVPTVKVGDHVDVGTLIAQPDGYVSSPVHSSVSGTVKKIDTVIASSGAKVQSVTVESDGLMTLSPDIRPPEVNSKEDLLNAIRDSGLVGLGGAGFPTHVKLNVKEPAKIEYLIINGAECEPYITADTRTMMDDAEDMSRALDAIQKYIGYGKLIVAVESNKRKAISRMKLMVSSRRNSSVAVLPSMYPQGGEKVLVYHTTGRIIPEGKLPIDVGCVVLNCTTLAFMGKYLKTGIPLVEKCVTVDGGSVKEPKNVLVPIGTAVGDVFEFCGGFSSEPAKILYGGPMMGIAVPYLDSPVLKNTNALLAFTAKQSELPDATQCIHCGSCANQCPVRLNPAVIAKAYRNGDVEALMNLGTTICMECGCCAYVCPARIHLVTTNRLAKGLVREALAKQNEKGGN